MTLTLEEANRIAAGAVEKARQLASNSIGTADPDANAKYWLQFPTGEDVMTAWKQLLARN